MMRLKEDVLKENQFSKSSITDNSTTSTLFTDSPTTPLLLPQDLVIPQSMKLGQQLCQPKGIVHFLHITKNLGLQIKPSQVSGRVQVATTATYENTKSVQYALDLAIADYNRYNYWNLFCAEVQWLKRHQDCWLPNELLNLQMGYKHGK